MAVVYKLTREDGLEYIGIAKNFKNRLIQHKNHSDLFKDLKIKKYEFLFEGTYQECYDLEEHFIAKYDTFNNGLNKTKHGKGYSNTPKFTTLGKVFSEESKQKMSEARKRFFENGGKNWSMLNSGYKLNLSEEQIKNRKFVNTREAGKGKLTINEVEKLLVEYENFSIPLEYVLSKCKSSQHELILKGEIDKENATLKSGHKISKIRSFSNIKSKELNLSSACIYGIIKKYKI